MMWKEQFGLTLEIEDRFKELLREYGDWKCDFDEKDKHIIKYIQNLQ
ncbi:hypothetical protein [Methanobacterium sp.]